MSTRALVTLAAAMLLTGACSVANPFAPSSSNNSRQTAQELALKFAQCMRQHGVNLPDPNGNGNFVQTANGPAGDSPSGNGGVTTGGIDPQSPQFQAAQNACKQYRPNGAKAGGRPSQAQIDALTKFSQCMRQHGVPMSDPQVGSNGGVSVQVQASPGTGPDPKSSQFQQAQQACQHFMPGGGPGSTRTADGS